jgi:hypothetical protein
MRQIGVALILSLMVVAFTAGSTPGQAINANHTVVSDFDFIPTSVIDSIGNHYTILYGHTSHGSQVVTGMAMLETENPIYGYNNGPGSVSLTEIGDDLGHVGDTSWVAPTRTYLNQPGNSINMVMWSWCGGCSDNTPAGIAIYLSAMEGLEAEYPDVRFVYMTGHLDGSGIDGTLYRNNNLIRDYCITHDKILFDFADIESYAPDGTYYPDETDACNWCADWCAVHTCPSCGSCAHSHCFNCYQKGKAFWWLMAETLGWSPAPCCVGTTGNVNADINDETDISDLTALVNHLFVDLLPLPCPAEANTDGDAEGDVDISDLNALVNHLFLTFDPLPDCDPDWE